MKSTWKLIFLVFIIAILYGVFYLAKEKVQKKNTDQAKQEEIIGNSQSYIQKLTEQKPEKIVTSPTDTSQLKIYRNKKYGFEIIVPVGWKEETKEDGVFLTKDDTKARIVILPIGGFGYGAPFEEPQRNDILVGKKNAFSQRWILNDGSILFIVQLKQYPISWSDQNRFDFHGQKEDEKDFRFLLNSFVFIN